MFSRDLLPGDLIEIPQNKLITCDILVLSGTSVVNEAVITGEAIPVRKNAFLYPKNFETNLNLQQHLS